MYFLGFFEPEYASMVGNRCLKCKQLGKIYSDYRFCFKQKNNMGAACQVGGQMLLKMQATRFMFLLASLFKSNCLSGEQATVANNASN